MRSLSGTDRGAPRTLTAAGRPPGSYVGARARSAAGLQFQQRLGLLVTAFLFPVAGATLVVPWLLGLRIWQLISNRPLVWVRSWLDFPMAGFLLLVLIAGMRSPLPAIALGSWLLVVLAFGVVLQAALDTFRETPGFVQTLHKAFALGTPCAAIYGLFVLYSQHSARAQLPWLGGNALGFGLMAGIFLMLPLVGNRTSQVWSPFAVAVAAAGLVATLSRGAFYGLAAGGITYLLLEARRLPLRVLMISALSLALGIAAALSNPLVAKPLAVQLAGQLRLQAPPQESGILNTTLRFLVSKAANEDRLPIWHAAVKVIRSHPWFGVGLGVFPFIVHQWAPEISPGTPPHSIYLDMGAEVGIPGAVAFVAMPVIAILYGLKHRNAYRHGQIAAMVGMMAADIRDHVLIGFHMTLGFILILAMLLTPFTHEEETGSTT